MHNIPIQRANVSKSMEYSCTTARKYEIIFQLHVCRSNNQFAHLSERLKTISGLLVTVFQ